MAELRVKSTGTLKLFENDNTSSVTIASPASLGADRTITLPDADVTLASGTMNDETFTDPIPSNKTDFCELVMARDDYKDRATRDEEAEAAIG